MSKDELRKIPIYIGEDRSKIVGYAKLIPDEPGMVSAVIFDEQTIEYLSSDILTDLRVSLPDGEISYEKDG